MNERNERTKKDREKGEGGKLRAGQAQDRNRIDSKPPAEGGDKQAREKPAMRGQDGRWMARQHRNRTVAGVSEAHMEGEERGVTQAGERLADAGAGYSGASSLNAQMHYILHC